jgi:hypothetical protein
MTMRLNTDEAAELVAALADAGCVATWRSDETLEVAVPGIESAEDVEQAPIELAFLVRAWRGAHSADRTIRSS